MNPFLYLHYASIVSDLLYITTIVSEHVSTQLSTSNVHRSRLSFSTIFPSSLDSNIARTQTGTANTATHQFQCIKTNTILSVYYKLQISVVVLESQYSVDRSVLVAIPPLKIPSSAIPIGPRRRDILRLFVLQRWSDIKGNYKPNIHFSISSQSINQVNTIASMNSQIGSSQRNNRCYRRRITRYIPNTALAANEN